MPDGKKTVAKARRSVSAVMYCAAMVPTAYCRNYRVAMGDRRVPKAHKQCTQDETGAHCVAPAGISGRFEALTRHEHGV